MNSLLINQTHPFERKRAALRHGGLWSRFLAGAIWRWSRWFHLSHLLGGGGRELPELLLRELVRCCLSANDNTISQPCEREHD